MTSAGVTNKTGASDALHASGPRESLIARWADIDVTMRGGPSAGNMRVGELEEFLRGRPSGILLNASGDWTVCNCALHRKVVCGVKKGDGCRARAHGKLPMLAVMYTKRAHHKCGASDATRECDQKMAVMMLDDEPRDAFQGVVSEEVMELCSASLTSESDWGAGFCYMVELLGTGRMRVGRILGPDCYALDVLRACRLVGLAKMGHLRMELVSGGLHVVRDKKKKGVDEMAGVRFVRKLMAAIDVLGDGLRIGSSGSGRGEDVRAFLSSKGVHVSDAALSNLRLAGFTAATMPMDLVDGKLRLRQLSLVGDRVLKLALAARLYGTSASMERIAGCEAYDQSDAALAVAAVDAGLMEHVLTGAGVNPRSAKVGGTAFEAVVGAVYLDKGLDAACACAEVLGAVVDVPGL